MSLLFFFSRLKQQSRKTAAQYSMVDDKEKMSIKSVHFFLDMPSPKKFGCRSRDARWVTLLKSCFSWLMSVFICLIDADVALT